MHFTYISHSGTWEDPLPWAVPQTGAVERSGRDKASLTDPQPHSSQLYASWGKEEEESKVNLRLRRRAGEKVFFSFVLISPYSTFTIWQ